MPLHFASIEKDGWTLESGEERHARSPETFEIPSRTERESLCPGDAATPACTSLEKRLSSAGR